MIYDKDCHFPDHNHDFHYIKKKHLMVINFTAGKFMLFPTALGTFIYADPHSLLELLNYYLTLAFRRSTANLRVGQRPEKGGPLILPETKQKTCQVYGVHAKGSNTRQCKSYRAMFLSL